VLRFLFVLAVGTWLGTVVCFSFVILPAIHRVSAPPDATRLLRQLFPRYYWAGIGCGFAALALVSLARTADTLPVPEALRLALPVAGGLVCSLIAYYVLQPRMRAAHDGDPERYAHLHRLSTMLNSTVLALLLLAVAGAVMR
jgi:drug/metabolite transporter (DMT)-like permease